MIELPSERVREYLAAIKAVAIYVAESKTAIHIAIAVDIERAAKFVASEHNADIVWLKWAADLQKAELIQRNVIPQRSVDDIIREIEHVAQHIGIVLTEHSQVIKTATILSSRVDALFGGLKRSGELKAFHKAYREYRQHCGARGEKVQPFNRIMSRLREIVIRSLVEHQKNDASSNDVHSQIITHFPWFLKYAPKYNMAKSLTAE